MTVEHLSSIFSLFGGLGMFLYGMTVMSDGMQKAAGSRMSKFLDVVTGNKIMAVILGAGITALIQSSSATTVMVVGFVNAGVMNLSQAVGIIMGANIGTTITAWMVSLTQISSDMLTVLKPDFFAPVLVGVGAFRILFGKKGSDDLIGDFCIGVGFIFIGLGFMSGAVAPYADSPVFSEAFRTIGSNPVLGILVGAVVTGVIQSSAASVSILQTLALAGAVPRVSGFYITLGQNIGTCITAMLSSTGTTRTAKRAAVIHLLFNVSGAVLFGIIIFSGSFMAPEFFMGKLTPVEISVFHTIFNILCTVVLFPLGDFLVNLSGAIVPEAKKEEGDETVEDKLNQEAQRLRRHLDERILESPAIAIAATKSEVVNLGRVVAVNISTACNSLALDDDETIQTVYDREKIIDHMTNLLTDYLIKIDKLSLSDKQKLQVTTMLNALTDIERAGDHAENIAEKAKYAREHNVSFTAEGIEDLKRISGKAQESYSLSLNAFEDDSIDEMVDTARTEDQVDAMEREMRQNHMQRLSMGECTTDAGIVFLDVIGDLERISDHADNIAAYVKQMI
ncbi:Na/Pi cotransporter family protein [Oribacterium sp. WCC10]|uniref:Na/Pi cotransporter family protein n=1 Tax=Oribacterium sp. WCC10 TaxID=1855343 RepID=UPI0008EFBE5A|nr:Na/Pi cotransporter family protein [Oribacterium sp. WCC10]SFG39564.1 phosphate:Na+ symporter [Oribacterium sp. WCC10]